MIIMDNKYILEEEIYSGPQSKVYVGRHKRNDNSKVIIKVLNNKMESHNGDIEEIFKRDSKALSLINNPNIIEYKDSGIDKDNLYIVMEKFDNTNLYTLIEKRQLSYLEKLNIMLKILDGIQAAHDKRIIHRDIKPSNVLVNSDFTVKVIDFGISKILDLNAYRTNYTLKDYVTKRYASPEHYQGLEVDARTDIFSLGCVLFFLLTEVEPCEEKRSILNEIETFGFTDNLKSILTKSLSYDKEMRYASILSFISDIENEIDMATTNHETLKIFVPKIVYRDLRDIGKFTDTSFPNVKSYIESSLKDPYIYKTPNNTYYLIGDDIRYQIVPETNKGYFKILRVFPIEKYSDNELEKSKGIELNLNIDITSSIPTNNSNAKSELVKLLKAINTNFERFKESKIKTQNTNQLIKEWEDVLKTINKINYDRKHIGNYIKTNYDNRRNFLIVEMDTNFEPSLIQDGDYLKLPNNGDKFINVGEIKEVNNNIISVALKPDIQHSEISKRGEAQIDLSMNNATLRRFNNALYALKNNEAVNKNLIDILINPSLLTMKNLELSLEFINTNIDPSNKNAVTEALKTNDIYLIQGPPGTGKSTVITEIINQIFKEDQNSKVLITSPSHVAVDHLLKNIVKDHKDKKIIRIGTSEKISKASNNLLATEQIKLWSEEVKNKSIDYTYNLITQDKNDKELKKYLQHHLKRNSHIKESELNEALIPDKTKHLVNIIRDWNNRLELLDEFDDIFAREASIVAATCVGISSRHALRNLTYDWVIIDEAARATAPELILPMLLGKKIILVGDHKQLPPIVNLVHEQEIKKDINIKKLEKSLFEEIFDKSSGEAHTTLTSQFRMHPTISKLVNESFYPSYTIKTKVSELERQHNLGFPHQVVWLDTSTLENNIQESVGKSFRNQLEVKVIQNELRKINDIYSKRNEKVKVAVISGYNAQKQLLINEINPEGTMWTNVSVQIDSIDAFQGSESDIVFYSLVRSNDDNKIGFLKDERRLNVALSRGRTCLMIVGNKESVLDYRTNRGNSFNKIIRFIKAHPKTCDIKGATL
ncbi:serine/threonine-protein kinase [Cytobacillus praedii]|uniref:serine/threonine-protein kinase n=1 Tax=Cytobacillus praedii TaxID=1742358 RepID=UPI002E2356F0|nr:AAA domain-containing protein [Cytobacillus praedii]MED3554052.1 AAA domain-containing protein [Cytobacillus praedii]